MEFFHIFLSTSLENEYLGIALLSEKNEVKRHLIETTYAFESLGEHPLTKEADHFATISKTAVHFV